jgi:hypothetical protein
MLIEGRRCNASALLAGALLAGALLTLGATRGSAAGARPPIADPVKLNIGLNCQWQQRCMAQQEAAMERALHYVRKARPASWRIHQCNRNAARSRSRVDWIGFDNCIRNAWLRPTPARPVGRRGGRIT